MTVKTAGTHLHPASLTRRMHDLDITARASRKTAAAPRLDHPPAVFASDIGSTITTRWAGLVGAARNSSATTPEMPRGAGN